MEDRVTYLGTTNSSRTPKRRFGIRTRDRFSHIHILGKTGTGKSTLLEQMVLQDARHGDSAVLLIDPHGDLARSVRDKLGASARVRFLDATSSDWSFNPLRRVARSQHPLAVAALVSVFARNWEDSWGPRVEHLLRNCLYVLLAQGDASLADLPRLLHARRFQRAWVPRVENPPVRDFFEKEWPRYSSNFRGSMQAPLMNKLGALLADPRLRRSLCGTASPIRLAKAMAQRDVVLVDLAKGAMGEEPSRLLGSVLLAYAALAGLARVPTAPTFIYVDELGSVASTFVASMLEELRKRRVGLTVAHQHLSQLGPDLADAVIGNAGTRIAFRLGSKDAVVVAREFAPRFVTEDLLNLPSFQYYLRLLVDGHPSQAFSAGTDNVGR